MRSERKSRTSRTAQWAILCLLAFARPGYGSPLPALETSTPSVARALVPPHTFPNRIEAKYWHKDKTLQIEDVRNRLFRGPVSARFERAGVGRTTLYTAAVNSLTAMLRYAPEHYALSLRLSGPGEDVPAPSNLYFGNWELSPTPEAEGLEIASLEERIRWHDELRTYYQSSPAMAEHELENLWDWFASDVLARSGHRRSEILAAGINAWHQTLDPHARILPVGYLEENIELANETPFESQLDRIDASILPTSLQVRATYMKLTQFYMAGAAATIIKKHDPLTDAYILDLRGNAGGYFDDARQYLNLFLDPTVAQRQFYVTKSRSSLERENFYSQRPAETKKLLVVLVDATTKSAAELFAGVLQQYQRAWIVGDTTFGKGTSVSVTERFGIGAVLRESTHVLHYPNGGSPQLVGVTPDFPANTNSALPRVINLYTDPLPREAPHFIQTRGAEILKLTSCMDAIERGNRRIVDDIRSRSYKNDYVLVRALLLLQCQMKGLPASK